MATYLTNLVTAAQPSVNKATKQAGTAVTPSSGTYAMPTLSASPTKAELDNTVASLCACITELRDALVTIGAIAAAS